MLFCARVRRVCHQGSIVSMSGMLRAGSCRPYASRISFRKATAAPDKALHGPLVWLLNAVNSMFVRIRLQLQTTRLGM